MEYIVLDEKWFLILRNLVICISDNDYLKKILRRRNLKCFFLFLLPEGDVKDDRLNGCGSKDLELAREYLTIQRNFISWSYQNALL